jgi:hypothetical protein
LKKCKTNNKIQTDKNIEKGARHKNKDTNKPNKKVPFSNEEV